MDLDTLAQQAGDVTGPTPDQLHRGRRHLAAAAALATDRVTAQHRSRRTTRVRRRRWAVTALAAAATVTTVAVVLPLGGAPSASADEVLLLTAASAGEQPDLTGGATHWYVGSEADAADTEPFTSEIWYSRDQPTILRDGALAAGYLNDGIEDPSALRTQALDQGEGGPITTSSWYVGGDESLTWDDLEELPTDPDELDVLLRAGAADHPNGVDEQLWSIVVELLWSPASPALRQALWEVAARIPGVELLGPMSDGTGRQGTAIMRSGQVLVVDPGTGALLELQWGSGDGDYEYRQTALVQEPVETVPEPDLPRCGPGSEPERSC